MSTRFTDQTATLIGHKLTNSQEKTIQSGVIDLRLPDYGLIYCTRKLSLLKSLDETSVRSVKRYFAEKFLQIVREVV